MHNSGQGRPKIAIIDPNTLSVLGLKHILQNVIPIMTVDSYGSFAEFMANKPEDYFHYFTAMNIVLENKAVRDQESYRMITLMHENKTFDFGFNFDSSGSIYGALRTVVLNNNSTDFASFYQKNEQSWANTLAKVCESFGD